jgi:DedD protein
MARSISDEELQLRKRARRRLIGAIVLVTAIAVVLPMVLDTEPKPVDQDISIKIPSPDSGAFNPKIAPSAAAPRSEVSAPGSTPAPTHAVDSKPPVASAPTTKAAASTKKAEAETHAPGKPTAPAAKSEAEQFVVQVVALADASKAKQILGQMSGAGVKSYTEVVKTAKGDVTRVRAGPFTTREAAEKTREKLKSIGLDGKVIPVK